MKTNGILLGISSLPSKYGIGDFGENAYKFVDLIKEAGVKIWQILPLNPLGFGNSPYQSVCSNAIDPIYIDLEDLEKQELISDLKPLNANSNKVDYKKVREFKNKYLKEAFEKQEDTKKQAFKDFVKENPWVVAYAKFSILLRINSYSSWWTWSLNYRYDFYKNTFDYSSYEKEILFIEWVQFVAFKQFYKLKKYINKSGIELMGDIPFYVAANSSDAWANQDEFLLDENDEPSGIAGVPPDYFSKTGQRWGNLLYDWEYMKDDNFTYWMNRIESVSKMYDIIRIDHFRAFDTYWVINPECDTAIDGKWLHAYGDEFLGLLFKKHPNINLIAEDLGDLVPSVGKLRDKYNLLGMNVFEFNIFNKKFASNENQIIYTGTHDNETIKGWYNNLLDGDKELLKIMFKELRIKGRAMREKILNYCFESPCKLCIIPVQDYLGLGNEARMNVPGTCGSPNWEFKLKNFDGLLKEIPNIKELNLKYKR